MRAASATVRELIRSGGFNAVWTADLMYNGERRLAGVGIRDPRPSWDAGQFVAGSLEVGIVWSDDHARSIIPKQIGDWFSPFGAELQLDVLISAGSFQERVPVGRFVIDTVPDATERGMLFDGLLIHPGQSFTVQAKDRMWRLQGEEFPFPTARQNESAWTEIQRITGMPIIRTVDDATVPAGLAYEGKKADVLNALFDLMQAWPHLDPAGTLTGRPKAWPDPVDEFTNVISAPRSLESSQTYNQVVVEGKSSAGAPIFAVAEVNDGFLRVRNADGSMSPFGVRTYRYQSDFLTTGDQCDAYARELLPRVSKLRGVTREVVEPFNPLREIGDVVLLEGGPVRIRSLTHDRKTTRSVVEVPDA